MSTLELLLEQVAKWFQPLARRIEDREVALLFAELGLELPESAEAEPAFSEALVEVSSGINSTLEKIDEIKEAVEANDKPAILAASSEALVLMKAVFDGLRSISESLKNDIGAAVLGVSEAVLDDFVEHLPERLAEYLVVRNIEDNVSGAADLLEFIGVIKRTEILNSGNPVLPDFTKRELNMGALVDFVSGPSAHLENLYDWNKPNFDGQKLFPVASKILLSRGVPVIYDQANSPSVLSAFFARITVDSTRPAPGLLFEPTIDSYAASFSIDREDWKFKAGLEIDLSDSAQISVFPDGKIKFNAPGFGGGKITASWEAGYPDRPLDIIGIAGASRVEAKSLRVSMDGVIDADGSGELVFTGELSKVNFVVDFSSGDNFVKKAAGDGFQAELDLKFGYSTKSGFFLEGSGALEITVPTHISLGPIDIMALTIALAPREGKIPLSVGADVRTTLGPLMVQINEIGFRLDFAALETNDGNLGRLEVTPGFKPPTGIAVSVNSAGFKGGGTLDLDPDNHEYFGALELEFQDLFTLKAFGIINTRLPDGSDGFSLLIIITAEFNPIQLGFGFTLNGVGGLIGINRTTRIEVLKEGIKTNAIKSILFPENLIANISRIVSDIKQVFPPQNGHYLFAPMGKIGWGTPSIITLELGLLIEIPVPRLVILGVLKALLPKEDAPLLQLQVNFIGDIDFENKTISFDAVLYDSKLLTFALTGQMALRIGWGDAPVFVLSVGGFHPAFKEIPAGLGNLERLTIAILNKPKIRITVQNYFAVTSNTVQFGAKAELYASNGGSWNIYGFVAFDVLFQFDPFRFIADVAAGLALRRNQSVIMGIRVSGSLTGPAPWDVKGEASVSFFFFSVSIPFHETWGPDADPATSQTIDLMEMLRELIADDRSWRADIPSNNNLHVSIKEILTPPATMVIHPFGVLTFSERLVPLEIDIDRFGNKLPQDARRFEIKPTAAGLRTEQVREQFAPANFIQMTDSEKLARPSFEPLKSGFKITGSDSLMAPLVINKSVQYEFSYLGRKPHNRPVKNPYLYEKLTFKSNAKGGAIAKSPLSANAKRNSLNAPEGLAVKEERFAVANVSDMTLYDDGSNDLGYTEAVQRYDDLVRQRPALRDQIQVLSQFEVNAA